jgi:surface antigen
MQTAPKVAVSGIPFVNALAATKLSNGLTQQDIKLAVGAELSTLKYAQPGVAEQWQNPKSGNSGLITAGQPYRIGEQDCRRYQHILLVNGIEKRASGTACSDQKGLWRGLE